MNIVVQTVKQALEKMDKDFVSLSKIRHKRTNIGQEKYLERPFAYEFYHQLRKIMENGPSPFGNCFVQGEVAKAYQEYPKAEVVPDFIVHIPDSQENLVVIEFKLATRDASEIQDDFEKLRDFETAEELRYKHGIEVIIGNEEELKQAARRIKDMGSEIVSDIEIIYFNTTTWKALSRY